jgi:hypothetical protein
MMIDLSCYDSLSSPLDSRRLFTAAERIVHVADRPSTKPTPLSRNFFPITDIRMRSISLGPRPTDDPVDPIYMLVGGGDWLFALDSRGSFSVLCPVPLDPRRASRGTSARYSIRHPRFRAQACRLLHLGPRWLALCQHECER